MGDVFGPASSTDNAVARFNGTTGKLIKNSFVIIADASPNVLITEQNDAHIALQITTSSASGQTVSQFVMRNPGGDRMFEINLGANITTQTFDKISFVTPAETIMGIWAKADTGERAATNYYSGTAGSDFMQVGHVAVGAGATQLLDQPRTGLIYVNALNGLILVAGGASGILRIGTGGTATTNERMRIDASGLVGINTTTPGAQAHIVSGAAARVGLIVDSAASPSVDIAQFRNNTSATAAFAVKQDGMYTYPGVKRVTADVTVNNSTTLVDVTDLSVNVRAGRSYRFRLGASIIGGSITSGVKVDLGGGTATQTAVRTGAIIYTDDTNPAGFTGGRTFITVALTTAIEYTGTGSDVASYLCWEGIFVVNAGGTVIPRFAQAVAAVNNSILRANSYFEIVEIQ